MTTACPEAPTSPVAVATPVAATSSVTATSTVAVRQPAKAFGGVRAILVLGTLIALGPLTIDMYLPALPALGVELDTTAAAVQLTLTGTLIGLAMGQLLVGPLSDAFGRRRPLIAGMSVHLVASLLSATASSVAMLGILRVFQGFGAASAGVVAMAVVRDLYSGRAAGVLFSRLMLVMGVAPVLAPTLGGELLRLTNWRGLFVAMALGALALIVLASLALPETHPAHRRRRGGVAGTLRTYQQLLSDRVFVGLMLVAGLTMSALFAYVSGSSFVLQQQYGLDEQTFGLVFGVGAISLIAATQLNARLLKQYDAAQVVPIALGAGATAAVVMLIFAALGIGGLLALLVPLWTVLGAVGLTLPNIPALALSQHGEAAGTAAALLGAVQFGLGAAVSPVVGLLGTDSIAMATVMTAALLTGALVLALVVRPSSLPTTDSQEVMATAH